MAVWIEIGRVTLELLSFEILDGIPAFMDARAWIIRDNLQFYR